MHTVNVQFDPMSSSLTGAIIVTLCVLVLGMFGFWLVLRLKTEDEEQGTIVRGVYLGIFGLLLFVCLMITSCQTTGCDQGGNFKLLQSQNDIAKLQAEKALLQSKLTVAEAEKNQTGGK